MKIIVETGDSIATKLAAEMFNIELGKYYFEYNGEIAKKQPYYPMYHIDGVSTSIKTNRAYLILPANFDEAAIHDEYKRLKDIYIKMTKKDHLQEYAGLNTHSNHFTKLKAINKHYVRKIQYDIIYIDDHVRFTWHILRMDAFLQMIEDYFNSRLSLISQIVTVLYDKNHLYTYNEDTILSSQLSIKDLRVCQNFQNIIYFGDVSRERIDDYKSKILPNHISRDLNEIVEFYNSNPKKGIISLNMWHFDLVLCPIRKGSFEIIRHYGNWNIFCNSFLNLPIQIINKPIYEVDFLDVCIDNTFQRNDVCNNCATPLYDEFYMKFSNNQTCIGVAICAICMHSTFTTTSIGISYSKYGDTLYTKNDILAKVKHPRSILEIIASLQVDPVVKKILISSFSYIYVEQYHQKTALYFGLIENFDKSEKLPESDIFISWNDSLTDYAIEYCPGSTIMKKYPDVVKNAIIFPANILTPNFVNMGSF
jgi:hypothetical protein